MQLSLSMYSSLKLEALNPMLKARLKENQLETLSIINKMRQRREKTLKQKVKL